VAAACHIACAQEPDLGDAAGDEVFLNASFGGKRGEAARALNENREPFLWVLDEVEVVNEALLWLSHGSLDWFILHGGVGRTSVTRQEECQA